MFLILLFPCSRPWDLERSQEKQTRKSIGKYGCLFAAGETNVQYFVGWMVYWTVVTFSVSSREREKTEREIIK